MAPPPPALPDVLFDPPPPAPQHAIVTELMASGTVHQELPYAAQDVELMPGFSVVNVACVPYPVLAALMA